MLKYLKYYFSTLLIISAIYIPATGVNYPTYYFIGFSLLIILGDYFLGEDVSQPEYSYPWLIELPLHLALPIITAMLLSFAWASGSMGEDFLGIGVLLSGFFSYDFLAARDGNIWSDYIGGILGVGFMVAGYGTNVAHELTHRIKDRFAMLEGRWLLSASCNADFSIEHVYGHHVTVGTNEDPATARKGENIYTFAIRSTVFGHISAWKLELQRLRKKDYGFISLRNRMITGYLMSLVWCALFYCHISADRLHFRAF